MPTFKVSRAPLIFSFIVRILCDEDRIIYGNDLVDHTLEFLLAFDGRIHHFEGGYWIKFEIKCVERSKERPHGLAYSFTLHDPKGMRLIGFDNAHQIRARGSRLKQQPAATDHWHRTEKDGGRPYPFKDAETLIDDFFDEVERVLSERGIPTTVLEVEETRKSK